jgi:hypothetical protein
LAQASAIHEWLNKLVAKSQALFIQALRLKINLQMTSAGRICPQLERFVRLTSALYEFT